jgi:hypothetical protein
MQPQRGQEPPRDATSVWALGGAGTKVVTNSTAVRGLDYQNSVDVSASTCLVPHVRVVLRELSNGLEKRRSEAVHFYHVCVVMMRCFLMTLKVLLWYNEEGRALWFAEEDVRLQLGRGFASYFASRGHIMLVTTGYPEALQSVFWAASRFVINEFNAAESGWADISQSSVLRVPLQINHWWHTSNVDSILENDELLCELQGRKFVQAILAVITSAPDFDGAAAREFKEYSNLCKKMLWFVVETHLARFPEDEHKKDMESDDDDDDKQMEDEIAAAVDFDEELQKDPNYKEHRKKNKAEITGEAVLKMTHEEEEKICTFTKLAKCVVSEFAEVVKRKFEEVWEDSDRASRKNQNMKQLVSPAIQLPARTRDERRKVIYVAHHVLDQPWVDKRRLIGNVQPYFYYSDFKYVCRNVFIGNEGGAFHAGSIGFSLVINCAASEVPNFYEGFQGVEYVSLNLPGGPNGIRSLSDADKSAVFDAVRRHGEGKKILIHCKEGRHRSAAIVFLVLREVFHKTEFEAFEAVFKAVPHMDFYNIPQHFERVMVSVFKGPLKCVTFANSTEHLRIQYSGDNVLPVITLAPFYTFKSGESSCTIVDYFIEFGVKRFSQFDIVSTFFARHIYAVLEHLSVRQIHLVVYPSHSAHDESKLVPIVRKLCEMMPDRFLDGTHVLQRTVDSPQRSKGGDRNVNVQFNTIHCELPQGGENAVYCCVDDVLNTGSSFHVFAELMTRAGANSENLHGLALGRFTARGPGHETQSEFVIPASSIASDISVSAPACVCLDVSLDFEHKGCREVSRTTTCKTVAFLTPALALSTARSLLVGGTPCCPHFAVDDLGFPCQLVSKVRDVGRVMSLDGKSLYVLEKVGAAEGSKANKIRRKAHLEWSSFGEEERSKWHTKSTIPPSLDDVRLLLKDLYPASKDGDLVWEILKHGGGNLVRFASKNAFKTAQKNKEFGKRGYVLEDAFGSVRSRVWISLDNTNDENLQKIQALSRDAICTMSGSSLTASVLGKHDGGVLSVVGEKLRVDCPQIKICPDPTWSPTMQFCNPSFLGLVSWNVLREVHENPACRDVVEPALEFYFDNIVNHCTVTRFGGRSAHDAAVWISGLVANENVLRREIDAALPLLALFHFSWKDIYRCMQYRDKLRGLSTAGGTIVHVALYLPDLPWTGNLEAQKTVIANRELSGVSRGSAPFPQDQAVFRITALHSVLECLPSLFADDSVVEAQTKSLIETKAEAEKMCKVVLKAVKVCLERVLSLSGIARELVSFDNAPGHRGALVEKLFALLGECENVLRMLGRVGFPKKVMGDGVDSKVGTSGLKKKIQEKIEKVQKTLENCKACAKKWRPDKGTVLPNLNGGASPFSALNASESAREKKITLVFGNDSGADGDCVTALPEIFTWYLFEESHGRNLASRHESELFEDEDEDEHPAGLMNAFRLKDHTLRINLTVGLAKEARKTVKEQKKMADYVAFKNEWIAQACHKALERDLYPFGARHNPLTSAGKRVAESLLELEPTSIMSAPHTFVGSSSTVRVLERAGAIILRSAALCEAYNVPLYRDARGRTRRGMDKIAQMQTNKIELVTLKFANDPIVQMAHRLSHGEDVNVQAELDELRLGRNHSLLDLNLVAAECPILVDEQLPYLIIKSCEVLHALQGSIVNYSKHQMHDEIANLRKAWSQSGKDPPVAIFCNGTWNRGAPGRGSFGSAWHRAGHRRATNRNLIRRAKQIGWHLNKERAGQEKTVTPNFLWSVNIQSKQISEIRSTKQALDFTALLSHVRTDTRGPPQSLFPGLSKDRPWKLRWVKGNDFVVHRDHMASCALAFLGMWERYAFAHNQLQELIDPAYSVLPRPAVYLYHTDYAKWTEGTLKANKALRW